MNVLKVVGLDLDSHSLNLAEMELRIDSLKIVNHISYELPRPLDLNNLRKDWSFLADHGQKALQTLLGKNSWTKDKLSLVIGFSSDLLWSITQTLNSKRSNRRVPFSRLELDELLERNQEKAFSKILQRLKLENQKPNLKMQLLNSSLINCDVDGHFVSNPIDQLATNINLQIYNVFIPSDVVTVCQNLAKNLNLNLVALSYKPFALMHGLLGHKTRSSLKCLLIHINQQSTDVALVVNGVLVYSSNFNLGFQIFHQALKRHFNLDDDQIKACENTDGSLNLKSLSSSNQTQALKILNHTASVWLQALVIHLKDFNLNDLDDFQPLIYLNGHGLGLSMLTNILHKPHWSKLIGLKKSAQIVKFDLKLMKQVELPHDLKTKNQFLGVLAGLGQLASDLLDINSLPIATKNKVSN